ncbi:unnamed protein product [Ostreobium quekettii]|uniref:Uncharacterized protein n=1 Tax=Ostreobium quekettii TaxID=121088 RepID=A0A8S1J580_9CHLO|nr:unnamed protein product [Ostreobium quekettii]|eukprot:evm.model.scf_1580EXC.1 EVM.evm.TU.scf_1580EXC.1   scf_1580EXC:25748-27267(-)
MVRAAGAMEAAAKAQEDLAQQQQAGLRLGLQGRSMMPSPYEQQDFAHRQAGLQAGESSVGGAPDPTAVDEALKDLAAWFNQQNSSSAAGPSQAHEGSQTVQLLTMLQELIKTQREGGQPPGSARASSLDLQQPRRQQQAHSSLYSRLSVDSITSQLQGQLCLGSHRPSPSVQALQREADPVQSGAMRVAVTSEGQGLLWDPGRSDLQRRLSLDSRHWGHQY